MSRWQLTPRARRDLFEIWDYIAEDDSNAANRFEQAVFQSCNLLSKSPLAGSIRENLTSRPVRFWVVQPYSNYLLVYDPAAKPVQILRIIHAARDLRVELRR
jgi:antitoxin ParD1/3/4